LSSVEPSNIWYHLSIPESTIDYGYLSALQLEAVVYTCQKHQVFLPCGDRAGFLIGQYSDLTVTCYYSTRTCYYCCLRFKTEMLIFLSSIHGGQAIILSVILGGPVIIDYWDLLLFLSHPRAICCYFLQL